MRGVQLIFNKRAKRSGSFGERLLASLITLLAARAVNHETIYAEAGKDCLLSDFYPIVWECPETLKRLAAERRFALCLNDQPPPGIAASFIDAVTTDDFSGGACAADLLCVKGSKRVVVLGGPEGDQRSRQRIAGFRTRIPTAKVVCAESWDFESGLACAPRVMSGKPAGVFACSDRLAHALIHYCRENHLSPPTLVGFDNAPVAEQLHLTTVGIPWSEMAAQAVTLAQSRLNNSTAPARLVILSHEPIRRLTA